MSRVGLWWLVAALVLANLAYLFWPRPELAPHRVRGGVVELQLIASTAGKSAEVAAPAASATAIDVGADGTETLPVESAGLLEAPAEVAALDEAPVATVQCWELGPLQPAEVAELESVFSGAGLTAQLIEKSVTTAGEFRVYLARPQDADELNAQQQRLLDLGVESYVIGGGELDGNLSLGLFSNRVRAEAFVENVGKEGFSAEIYDRLQTTTATWLGINSEQVAALGWSADLSELPLTSQPGIVQADCPVPE